MRFRGFIWGLAGFASLMVAGFAGAQGAAQPSLIRIPNRSYIGFNPLGVPFDIFSLEAESGVAQGITLGGVGSYTDVSDDRWESIDFKFRYYPGEVVLDGLSAGASIGFMNYRKTSHPTDGTRVENSVTSPTVGILVDYNWMLGAEHRFIVGTGLGVKRVLASSADRAIAGLDRAYPTARFTIGLAF